MFQRLRLFRPLALLLSVCFLAPPALAAAQATPVAGGAGTRTIEIPGEMVFPEGVAFHESTRDFFVSSTNDGTIYRGNLESGNVGVLLPGGEDGRTTAIGLEIDDLERLVIAGGSTGMAFVYDADTGQLISSYSNGLTGEATFLNDIAITPDGTAFVTDSFNPVLYRIPATGTEPAASPTAVNPLEEWLPLDGTPIEYQDGFNLNGIVVNETGSALLVVQGNTGKLFRIDLGTEEITEVDLGGETLTGGDGLVLDGSTLYVVNQGQITVVDLSADLTAGTIRGSFTDPTFSTPTTAAKTDGCLLVVNSQFANRGDTPELPFTLSVVPIPPEFYPELPAGTPAAQALGTPVTLAC